MRLLKYENNSFSLTRFLPDKIPQVYAILSHRWTSDEVTLKDLKNGTARKKAGYDKLKFCSEQAAPDGILYFWIDTCCINRASSQELTEAINSMFKWYENSTKCYVYMPDVSVTRSQSVSPQVAWMAAFRNSVWFTRGWTLQELIAPTSVEFFSVEGEKLGDKISLEQEIVQITGLPVKALRGEPLSQFGVEERRSWARRRVTTIKEDIVYCLLGLFDVHMPLLYGEGPQKALCRLQDEIGKANKEYVGLKPLLEKYVDRIRHDPTFTWQLTSKSSAEMQYWANVGKRMVMLPKALASIDSLNAVQGSDVGPPDTTISTIVEDFTRHAIFTSIRDQGSQTELVPTSTRDQESQTKPVPTSTRDQKSQTEPVSIITREQAWIETFWRRIYESHARDLPPRQSLEEDTVARSHLLEDELHRLRCELNQSRTHCDALQEQLYQSRIHCQALQDQFHWSVAEGAPSPNPNIRDRLPVPLDPTLDDGVPLFLQLQQDHQ